jgi:hypothetical protein
MNRRSGRAVALGLLRCLGLAVVVVTSCASGKREAASLVAAVDRYRKAEMGAKGPLADAIAAVACSTPEVCAAKEACVASARPTVEGIALKAEVEAALADLHAGKLTQEEAASRGLAQKLDRATQLLDDGHAKLPACDAKITAMRLEYGL